MSARTYLSGASPAISELAINILVDDQGLELISDLLALSDNDVEELAASTGIPVKDKNRLRAALAKLHAEQAPPPPAQNAPVSQLQADRLILKVTVPSQDLKARVSSALEGLEKAEGLSRNIRELFTIPSDRNAGAIVFRGPPFQLAIVKNRSGLYESLRVDVCEPDHYPSIVLSLHGATESWVQTNSYPPHFDHTKLFAASRIKIEVCLDPELEACSVDSYLLDLLLGQLLGGTNKAVTKLSANRVKIAVEALEKQIVLNEEDTMLSKIKEFVEPFTTARDFSRVVHRGALLWGPAGGAKTTVARAISNCGFTVAFDGNLVALGNEFQNSASKGILNLFSFSRHYRHLPVLLVCDEIDRVVQKRDQYSSQKGGGGHEQENALTMLLALLTDAANENIFVIGTTNKFHSIDEAALRPGRIGLPIFVGRLSPKSAKVFVIQLLRQEGYTTAANDLQRLDDDPSFVRMIFNLTGAFISHSVKALCLIDRPPKESRWKMVEPLLAARVSELRNPAVDPSSLSLTPSKQSLLLSGSSKAAVRAISRQDTIPGTDFAIFRSTFILNAATGHGFLVGNNHNLHIPLSLLEVNPLKGEVPQRVSQPAVFADVVGAICADLGAVSVEVVNQSTLPEPDEIAAFAHQQSKMAQAGLRVVAIHMDSIIGVNYQVSRGESSGLSQGQEKNYSLAKSRTDTKSVHESTTNQSGFGTDWSGNVSRTSGWSQTQGSSTDHGWFWDSHSSNNSDTNHQDVSVGTSRGFNKNTSWSQTKGKDSSVAIGLTETTGGSQNESRTQDRSFQQTMSLEDPMLFRRLSNLVQELQYATNLVVAVISSRKDSYTLKLMVSELGIDAPMRCSICQSNFHDPTCLLMGREAVPCCNDCFHFASHRIGIDFDDGLSHERVDAVLQELMPALPMLEEIECCAVEGLLNPATTPTVLRCLERKIRDGDIPRASSFTFHGFGQYTPNLVHCDVQRIPPLQLLDEPEKLRPHLQRCSKTEDFARATLVGSEVVIPRVTTEPKKGAPANQAPSQKAEVRKPPEPVPNLEIEAPILWGILSFALVLPKTVSGSLSKLLQEASQKVRSKTIPDVKPILQHVNFSRKPQSVLSLFESLVECLCSEDAANEAVLGLLTSLSTDCTCFKRTTTKQRILQLKDITSMADLAVPDKCFSAPSVECSKCRRAITEGCLRVTEYPRSTLLMVGVPPEKQIQFSDKLTLGTTRLELAAVALNRFGDLFLQVEGQWYRILKGAISKEITMEVASSPAGSGFVASLLYRRG